MMEEAFTIRTAAEADAGALLRIYAPYVTETAVTFEYEVPSPEEFARRIRETLKRYPYLVAEKDGSIAGYAYASPFKARAAYAWAVETSIYVERGRRGRGIGKALYLRLEELLRRQNVLNMNACIAFAGEEDGHLDNVSAVFHTRLGYREAAHFTKCGYKFGTWYDMIWMEKLIGEHSPDPKPFIPFSALVRLGPESV